MVWTEFQTNGFQAAIRLSTISTYGVRKNQNQQMQTATQTLFPFLEESRGNEHLSTAQYKNFSFTPFTQ
jgi:hypothetical protein